MNSLVVLLASAEQCALKSDSTPYIQDSPMTRSFLFPFAVVLAACGQLPAVSQAQTAPPSSTGQPTATPGQGMPPIGAPGQAAARPRPVRSPEVAADDSVIFRVNAPNATEVLLNGTWPDGRGLKMTKNEAGLWSITVGPLPPELWTYTFSVDGVSTLDSANPNLQRDGTRYLSFVVVDGAPSGDYEIKDVPHGNVSQVWYDSATAPGITSRRMYIYTPPGYDDRGSTKYPVLYLLHGAGGDEDAWNNMGRASVILDNLIAAKKAVPMLVVMTNGNANQKMAPGYGVIPGQTVTATGNPGEVYAQRAVGTPGAPGAQAAVTPQGRTEAPPTGLPPGVAASGATAPGAAVAPGVNAPGTAPGAVAGGGAAYAGPRGVIGGTAFPESIVTDVVPYVEKHYNVIKNKDGRALAGLSMGGAHTLTTTNAHPAEFSYIGVFSMGVNGDIADKLTEIKKAGVKYYYVGHGKDDKTVNVSQGRNLAAQLQSAGINYHYNESEGGHTWANWRIYLDDFTPHLFQ